MKYLLALFFAFASVTAYADQSVVVIVDDSGSMAGRFNADRSKTKMTAAKDALISVMQTLPEDSNFGVYALNAGWVVEVGNFDLNQATNAVTNLYENGGTPLGTAMKIGADKLLELRAKEHYGVYRLLVITDGEANDSGLVNRYSDDIKTRGLNVDVIGVDMRSEHSLSQQFNYTTADNPDALSQAVSNILAESTATTDNGASDFEMLEGLDNEVAQTFLTSLVQSGNHPIGTSPVVEEDGAFVTDNQGNLVFEQEEGGIGAGGVVLAVVGLFVFIILVGVLFSQL